LSDHIKRTIADLQDELAKQESAVIETKKLINMLCGRAGIAPMYADAQLQPSGVALSIRSDQFYGQPLAGAIRTILEMRKSQGRGPATVNELYDALLEGGFKFDTKDEANAKRGLRISVTKNTQTFHRLPGPTGRIGLLEWYPRAKQPKKGSTVIDEIDAGDDGADREDE
jgi:hypothetical protein